MSARKGEDVTDVVFLENGEEFNPHENDEPRTSYDNKYDEFVSSTQNTKQATLTVYKYQGRTVNDGLSAIEKWPVDKFEDMESLTFYLRDHWGAGSYRVQVRDNGRIVVNEHLEVLAPKKVNTETTNDGQLSSVVNMLIERLDRQDEALARMYQQQNAPKNNDDSEMKFLEKMVIYKDLFGGNNSPTQNATSGLKQIKEVMEVAKELGMTPASAADDEPGFGEVLKLAAPLFEAANKSAEQKLHGQPQAQPAQKSQPTPEQLKAAQQRKQSAMFKAKFEPFINAAKMNDDPAFYAELALRQFGDEQAKAILLNDVMMASASSFIPEIKTYGAWFDDFKEHVKGMLGLGGKYAADYADELTPENESDTTGANSDLKKPDNGTDV